MKTAASILFLILNLSTAATAEPSLTKIMAADILAVHNRERTALRIPPLIWDEGLATDAAGWARAIAADGKLRHSTIQQRGNTGENLWAGTAGAYGASQMAESWAGEKKDFRYGAFPDVSKAGDWHVVGHYTQMIWKDTTKIGCGFASSGGWDFLVCRYAPPGNVTGQTPY